ncbi:GNAT family N-acetyltransferase [Leptolyngbya sp. FACHB-261]|uniref:GNAT family N-acetyltransferase n=1 Tax=Leptolyngbya sp. FACHB-261 TaxID=2692806 RepID=UPI0016830DDC|nr:GNAT family N-acetyltransferase [Leptolyngbya sp. FACHB-261]MBD2100175.1 GNAT family N-acetyltransferase [Leptolyngbya sp. FACHB-261]
MLFLRQYQRSDHSAVCVLHNLALSQVGANAGPGPWNDDLDQIEETYLQKGDFVVGFIDTQLVAMGALRPTSPARAEIKRMRIHPDYQRRGFGQQVLNHLEQKARTLGYKVLHLDTTDRQAAAQQFYMKNGYLEVERKEWKGMTMIFYEKNFQ